MKIKQFYVDNKDKINSIFENVLAILIFLVIVFSVYACGFYQGSYLESSDKENKKELVIRRNRLDSSNITYVNLLTDEVIDSDVHAYYNSNGSLVNSSALTLTNRFAINPSVNYVYGNLAGQVAYITYFDSNGNFISSNTGSGLLISPSNANYCALSVFNARLNDSYFYQGQVVYNYYLPPIQNILDDEYDEGYESGFYDSSNNLFQPQYCKLLIKQGYLYESYGEVDSILGNGYFNKNLFFLGNHLDFSYLYIALRADGLFQTALEFMISFDSNIRFYLSNLNLKVVPSDSSPIPIVEDLNLVVRTDGQLGESSQLFEFLEYDKIYRYDSRNLISSFWFSNYWPDSEVYLYNVMTYEVESFNKGFDSGFDKGYSSGYLQGEIDQDDYYNNLIIPSIKIEYEELGYSNGYDVGFVDGKGVGYDEGLSEGRLENNAILKPFELMVKGVEPVIIVLSSEIAPGITIGTIALIPLAVTMIVFLLKGLVL